jgi:FKBP12-rapamycin complex-associated protein
MPFWYDEFVSEIIKNSDSNSISAFEALAVRDASIKNSLFPIAFALFYYNHQETESKFINQFFDVINKTAYPPPQLVLRQFLSVVELFEILGTKVKFSPK